MSHRPAEKRTCVALLASLRSDPADDAEQVTQVLFGEEVRVDARRNGWCHVRTSYNYPGWVRAEAVSSDDPLAEARSYLGSPYEWGGMTGAGIDCSGLVHMAFRRVGVLVPRDADQQETAGRELGDDELVPGDLITYGTTAADHIAFWAGTGTIVHATGRDGVEAVIEEPEPSELAARRRKLIRFGGSPVVGSGSR
jgi:hypothetical protein